MKKTKIFSWCIYDFASTIFMMNVVSLCFVQWIDQTFGRGDYYYSIISTIVYILALFLYPITGEICDRGWKMLPLAILTILSIVGTYFIGYSQTMVAGAIFFAIAYLTYQLALTYYNSLINDIALPKNFGIVSGLGVAARYTGTIFGLLVIGYFIHGDKQILLPNFLKAVLLKEAAKGETIYANAFIPTAIMYLIFTIPLFIFIKPKHTEIVVKNNPIKNLLLTMKTILKNKNSLMLFLTIFIGGAPVYAAIHFMSVIIKKIGGASDELVIPVLIASTVFSIVGGVGFGILLRPIGNKKTFIIVLCLWTFAFLSGSFLEGMKIVWALGVIAGIGMGGYWASARILILDIAPEGEKGKYMSIFGIFVVLCGILGSQIWYFGLFIAKLINFSYVPQRISMALLALAGIISICIFSFVHFPNEKINLQNDV